MIVLNLVCRQNHRFEGWFASTEACDDQHRRGLLSCPFCNDVDVSRLPSGPRVISSARENPDSESRAAIENLLLETLGTLARSSENVGEHFAEEARRIHYQEAPPRNIRGVASVREARELLDEGIAILPVPVPADGETH